VEGYCHAKLSAVRIAGEVKHGPADSAALDELLETIREFSKLGPIIDMEVGRGPQGREPRTAWP